MANLSLRFGAEPGARAYDRLVLLGNERAIKRTAHRRDDMADEEEWRKTQLVYYCAVHKKLSRRKRRLRKRCSPLQQLQLTLARKLLNKVSN